MQSTLLIENDEIDTVLIATNLELKGHVQGTVWSFPSAGRLVPRDGDTHVQYWTNLLLQRKDGKNKLSKLGYSFTIEFSCDVAEFSVDSIADIARCRVAIRFAGNKSETNRVQANFRKQ